MVVFLWCFLWWCFCGGVAFGGVFVVVFLWGVFVVFPMVVFLWRCGVWWCFCAGVLVFCLWWCGGVFVVVV